MIFIPIRILEWTIILFLFYREKIRNNYEFAGCTLIGVFLSFTLDIPSILVTIYTEIGVYGGRVFC